MIYSQSVFQILSSIAFETAETVKRHREKKQESMISWQFLFHFQGFETFRNPEIDFTINLTNVSEQLSINFYVKALTHDEVGSKRAVTMLLHQAYWSACI